MCPRIATDGIPGAAAFVPDAHSLAILQDAVQRCRGCTLYRNATQAVFGEMQASPANRNGAKAQIMMIGEQPGDREDKEGRPFVGPAGKLLDRCLKAAGIDRKEVYVTNAVKHFKWEPRGKLRIHKKPAASEVLACRPWLEAEIDAVCPRLIVCLGAVAAQGLLGTGFKVTKSHGTLQEAEGLPPIVATAHPASILRALKIEDRERQTASLIEDLRKAAAYRTSHAA